jgi:hypothetical protein
MDAQTVNEAYRVTRTWKDPETGLTWLIFDGRGWDWKTVAAMPDVVECEGVLYVRSGWNSDTGTVHYRQAKAGEVARKVDTK